MITVSLISYTGIKYHPELLAEYAEECSIPAIGKPDPQWEMYEQMQSAGAMQGFGVFVDGGMVGFAGLLMWMLPHYGVKTATVESLFVSKPHRSSGAGIRLMSAIERYAKAAECRAVLYSAPAGSQLEKLLGRRYDRTNSVFCKAL